jgi:hypothetical protein
MSLIKGLMMLATSVAIVTTAPCEAVAKVVEAYLLFDIAGPDVADKLRSASLGNCKQRLVGHASDKELILQLACDEPDGHGNPTYLSLAVLALGQLEGVRRATVLVVGSQ